MLDWSSCCRFYFCFCQKISAIVSTNMFSHESLHFCARHGCTHHGCAQLQQQQKHQCRAQKFRLAGNLIQNSFVPPPTFLKLRKAEKFLSAASLKFITFVNWFPKDTKIFNGRSCVSKKRPMELERGQVVYATFFIRIVIELHYVTKPTNAAGTISWDVGCGKEV